MNDLDYLRMNKLQKLLHNTAKFFRGIPKALLGMLMGIVNFFVKLFKGIGNVCKDIVMTYVKGDWKTKISYTVMGFGSVMRGQWLRGLLFFVFQTVFNLYLWFFGIDYVSKLADLGTETTKTTAAGATVYGDNSFLIMLYGVLTLFFIAAFCYTWYVNVKQNRISEQILKSGKKLKSAKADLASMLDDQFHKTLLALPTLGVCLFTILPIIFMILVAFTNYDKEHAPPQKLFDWVGMRNFNALVSTEENPMSIRPQTNPDGTVGLTITAKNGDSLFMYVNAEDASEENINAAVNATLVPLTEFPVDLEAGSFALVCERQSRGTSYLKLTLPTGNNLSFRTNKAQLEATNALLEQMKGNNVTANLTVEGDAGEFTFTAADGTTTVLSITNLTEAQVGDIRAEFAIVLKDSQPLSMEYTDKADGSVDLMLNNSNGKSISATLPAADAEKVHEAKTIIDNGGDVAVLAETREFYEEQKLTAEELAAAQEAAGEGVAVADTKMVAVPKDVITMTFSGEGDQKVVIEAVGATELSQGDITFISATGEEVTLGVYRVKETLTASMPRTFAQVLLWTLIWAFFATFLNYFLGMLVAIMINKKGIKFKKLWRTVLVMTIAIPQFISLLYVSKMFAADGLVNGVLKNLGLIETSLPFWTNATWAKCTIIGINIWIGIPYLMLIATGILMNIPADLYESARIDGANAFQTYMKITLPYMLFVTGPYLLTSFTGNINNFNVIFLLSGGKPTGMGMSNKAGTTDLLITWLYKMTVEDQNYAMAAVLGILVFVVCAVINLVVYNLIPSVKNEEDFQ